MRMFSGKTIEPSIILEFYAELSVDGQQVAVNTRGGFAAVVHGAHDTVRHAESVERPTTCPRYARAQLFFHLAKFQISREHQKPDEADAHS
jgi:hypothetical protein